MEVVSEGVEVVLIDFTLSRLRTPAGNVQFCNLADDVWLFEQPKGDCQVPLPVQHAGSDSFAAFAYSRSHSKMWPHSA